MILTPRKMHILPGMGSKFCACPLKLHTKFWTHTPQNMDFIVFYFWVTIFFNCDAISLSETGPWSGTHSVMSGHVKPLGILLLVVDICGRFEYSTRIIVLVKAAGATCLGRILPVWQVMASHFLLHGNANMEPYLQNIQLSPHRWSDWTFISL